MNVPLSYFLWPNISLLCLTRISKKAERIDSQCESKSACLTECACICVCACLSENAEEIVNIHQTVKTMLPSVNAGHYTGTPDKLSQKTQSLI